MEDVVIIVLVFFIAFCVFLIMSHNMKKKDEFTRFMKLNKISGGFFTLLELRGKIKNREIAFKQRKIGHGKHQRRINQMEISVNNCQNITLELKPELGGNAFSYKLLNDLVKKANNAIKKIAQVKDIQIGDKKFDDSFIIKAENEEEAKAVLVPEIRSQMLQLKKTKGGFLDIGNASNYFHLEISGDKITFKRYDFILDCAYYGKALKMLFELAEKIEKLSDEDVGA
jgi:hypothetical protein